MSTFCNGQTLPSSMPMTGAELMNDYDVASNQIKNIGATNFYTLIKTQANLSVESSSEIQIIDGIDGLSNDNIKGVLAGSGFQELESVQDTQQFRDKLVGFLNDIKRTYCVYEKLYRYSLNDLFSNLSAPISDDKLKRSVQLNKKLLIIIAGVNRIDKFLKDQSIDFITQIAATKNTLESNTDKLKAHLSILENKNADVELHKRMVEYTEEKNRANRNLLSLYTLLNAIAFGAIFYIAKE
jgi:hypothetical protein